MAQEDERLDWFSAEEIVEALRWIETNSPGSVTATVDGVEYDLDDLVLVDGALRPIASSAHCDSCETWFASFMVEQGECDKCARRTRRIREQDKALRKSYRSGLI